MIIEATGSLLIDKGARNWCKLPYPNHPKGCPNYGRRINCPPQAPHIENVYDFLQPCWFVIVDFDLKAQAERMKRKHLNWTDRQCRCLLYWQGGVNKRLRQEAIIEARKRKAHISMVPEAMGIDIIKTLQNLGVPIKQRPTSIVYKAALLWLAGKGKDD